ncbi:MAG: CDP-glycerol glycerophosphotransferase family protein [Candidatus Thorarchaeota archaeon]
MMKLNRILKRALQRMTMALDYFWPKDSKLVLFGSHGGNFIGGNSKTLFDYITSQKDSILRCYYFTKTGGNSKSIIGLQPLSLKSYFIFLRAKTVIVTHGTDDFTWLRFSKKKHYIKLWHGRPGLKGDGYSIKGSTSKRLKSIDEEAKKTTAFLVCSRLEAFMRAYSNGLRADQILPLGYPRNDKLLANPSKWHPHLPSIFSDLPEYNASIVYAPTWRDISKTRFFPFEDFNEEVLQEWLKKKKILLFLRGHRNDEIEISESEYIRNLSFDVCSEVTEILPEIDIIITDYSSITADFLLLDRPIIYIPYDKSEFEQRVGFCYDDFDFWTPGPKISTFKEFLEKIEVAMSGSDGFEEQRQQINRMVNSYQTVNSSERIYKYLRSILGVIETNA